MSVRVLVTGATGFIGTHLLPALRQRGYTVRAAVRATGRLPGDDVETVRVGEIGADTDWDAALEGVDAVIHLAARAHVLRESGADPREAFMRVNAEGTRRLAEACVGRVNQLVFVSSIAVHGSAAGPYLDEDSPLLPDTPYGESKRQAEETLIGLDRAGQLPVSILRPPLVYGPQAPGNLGRLARAVQRGLPLPLASVDNRRSLVGVDHLSAALIGCLESPRAARGSFMVADEECLSTAEIIRCLARGAGRPAHLWPCPPGLLRLGGRLVGRARMISQLLDSLTVDARRLCSAIGPFQQQTSCEGLARVLAGSSNEDERLAKPHYDE